jgi:hypothetical protein
VDYAALGLESDVIAQAAEVAGLQQGRAVDLSAVQIPAGQGLWIVAGQGN